MCKGVVRLVTGLGHMVVDLVALALPSWWTSAVTTAIWKHVDSNADGIVVAADITSERLLGLRMLRDLVFLSGRFVLANVAC